jgi:outer membrane protein assembly factor BamB
MFKTIGAAAIALSLMATGAMADGRFFERETSGWSVYGRIGDNSGQNNRRCLAEYSWQDGSFVQVIKDLADGEIYIYFKNNTWNISDAVKREYRMAIEMTGRSGKVRDSFRYILLSKNSIVIPNLDVSVLYQFVDKGTMFFRMPGNIPDAKVTLAGTQEAIVAVSECIEAAKDLEPVEKPSTNRPQGRSF